MPVQQETERNPCNPSPCGANAICKERNGAGSCSCLPEYFGDPYTVCKPECVTNTDCPSDKACLNNKCKDPCPGICGINAECRVSYHAPICFCYEGYTGNPSTACHQIQISTYTSRNAFQSFNVVLFIQFMNNQKPSLATLHHVALTAYVAK